MALILAIEPDVTQAVILRQVISELVPADLCLVDSKAAALSALEKNVPNLILISAALPAHEEQELVAHLRATAERASQQTLMIPRLASPTDLAASGKRSFFKRGTPGEPVGCDPRIFANEVCAYLMRALEVKAAAPAVAEPIAGVQAPVKAKQKPGVTANAPKSKGAPPQGARPPVVPSRVPPPEVTKQPLVTANTAQWQEAPSHDAQPPGAANPAVPPVGPSHFSWLQRFAERMGTEHSAEQREEEPDQTGPWSLARKRAGTSLSSLASTLGAPESAVRYRHGCSGRQREGRASSSRSATDHQAGDRAGGEAGSEPVLHPHRHYENACASATGACASVGSPHGPTGTSGDRHGHARAHPTGPMGAGEGGAGRRKLGLDAVRRKRARGAGRRKRAC